MGVYKIKQYIIIRKDLKMPTGKLAAQAAHASVAALMKSAKPLDNIDPKINKSLDVSFTGDSFEWLEGDFAKVCLEVNSEKELKECYDKAVKYGIPCAYIEDNGTTVFNGVKTPTCVGIGPATSAEIEPLFKNLKLYK